MYSWLLNPVGGEDNTDDVHHSGKSTKLSVFFHDPDHFMLKGKEINKRKRCPEVIQFLVRLLHLLNPLRIKIAPFSLDYN